MIGERVTGGYSGTIELGTAVAVEVGATLDTELGPTISLRNCSISGAVEGDAPEVPAILVLLLTKLVRGERSGVRGNESSPGLWSEVVCLDAVMGLCVCRTADSILVVPLMLGGA
jgi:hypothetical protein